MNGQRARRARPVTVVVHRQDWFCSKVSLALVAAGLPLPLVLHDGADAVAVMVTEQPDLMIVQSRLPSVTGTDLAQRARSLAPTMVVVVVVVVVQVEQEQDVAEALLAGAAAVAPATSRQPSSSGASQRCWRPTTPRPLCRPLPPA